MRRLVLIVVFAGLGAAVPRAARAQATSSQPTTTPPDSLSSAAPSLSPGTQATAGAQTPAKTPPQTPAPAGQTPPQTPAPAAAATPTETPRSLFEPTWHEFLIGGRATAIDGDPARFQRYQDVRDGIMFTGARFATEAPEGDWSAKALADNVGWRDQRYIGAYERTGKFRVSGLWDEIPQFYSVDTKTPYSGVSGDLQLDDATQLAIQNSGGTKTVAEFIPLANQFELRERRDIGEVRFKATPTTNLDVNAAFNTQRHRGELPFGASFGFSNDVEVAVPYDSRTNDFTLGTEWTNSKSMLRVGYQGSWFDNLDPILVWDSPLRLTDATDGSNLPGRGRMTLWPSNSAQTISFGGYSKLAHRTQVTGFLSYEARSNDEPLQPFTINSVQRVIPLPRATTQADAGIWATNLNLVSHPVTDWRFNARFREYNYSNNMPATTITDYVAYDTNVSQSTTNGPLLLAHSRTTFDADATWNKLLPLALTLGYSRNNAGYDERVFGSTGENVFRIVADGVANQMVSYRAQYEGGDRTGSGLNEALLVQIGEQPGLRHYDLADRTRNRFTGLVNITPNEVWNFSVSGGVGNEDYKDSQFGLQSTDFDNISFGVDYQNASGFGGGGTYNYERYAGFQRSRSAKSDPAEFNNPDRDWTADSRETVHYFSIYASPPRIGQNTEARISYDFSDARGNYFQTIVPGGPLTPPNQLPEVFNKLQQLHIDVRHRISSKLAASFSYLYEPFRVFDFAFDPSVIDSIAQPSSLVMGYVYRPYTANSFVFGLKVFY